MGDRYENLYEIISFEGFLLGPVTYRHEEETILQPRLEELGFTNIKWSPGESDSFGPLTRICEATDKDGEVRKFLYG